MVFHGPNRSGRSRHGKPVFAMKTTAFKKCRFDNSAGRPGRSRSGGSRCLIRTQSTAVSSCRRITTDRKSTRLNSSHLVISYAVFCLKKKKKNNNDRKYTSASI